MPPWLHQDTTPLTLEGAYEEAPRQETQGLQTPAAPLLPRPAEGTAKMGTTISPVLLSRGVNSDGLPLRLVHNQVTFLGMTRCVSRSPP